MIDVLDDYGTAFISDYYESVDGGVKVPNHDV
jgi:hypothetical protein